MATGSQLDRIAALVQQVMPLAGKARGMPIEAADWNALIGAIQGILEVDRVQESTGQASLELGFARADHDHLGQVILTWLDPDLQARLGDASRPVSALAAVADLSKRVQGLATEVARLTTLVQGMQSVSDHSAGDDLNRDATLRGFETRFTGIEDLRGLVGTLHGQVDGLTANVGTVLDLRRSLTDAQGQPIDVAALQTNVTGLQALRDQLAGADGQPLRLRDVEVKLDSLQAQVNAGTGQRGALDDQFAALAAELGTRLDSQVTQSADGLRQELQAGQAAARAQIMAAVQTSEGTLRSEVEGSADQKIAASAADLTQANAAAVSAAVNQAKLDIAAQTTSALDQRLSGVPAQIQAGVAAARADIQAALQTQLSQALSAQIQTQVQTQVQAQITAQLSAATVAGLVQAQVASQLAAADVQGTVRHEVASQLAGANLAGLVHTEVGSQLQTTDLSSLVRSEVTVQLGRRGGPLRPNG
jgi:hypothetical protein